MYQFIMIIFNRREYFNICNNFYAIGNLQFYNLLYRMTLVLIHVEFDDTC
jgi:hypothetical protein